MNHGLFKMHRSPQGSEMSGGGADPAGNGQSQTDDQKGKQADTDQSQQNNDESKGKDPGKENFFLNLLKESKEGEKPEQGQDSKEKKDSSQKLSKEQLIELQDKDPEQFTKTIGRMAMQETIEAVKNELLTFQNKLAESAILSKAEGEGISKQDFAAFSEYYSVPINNKTLELYKMVTGKQKKSEFETLKKAEELQKGKQTELKQEKPKTDDNDPIARRIKMAERV